MIRDLNPDIIGITETWLSNTIDDETLGLNGFCIFRADRGFGNDPHGGVLLAIKSKLYPTLVAADGHQEVVIAKIEHGGTSSKFIVGY